MENIGLQDSLLSRFDLLFVLLDNIDSDLDHIISDHVVRMHRYRNPNEQDGEALPFSSGLDTLSTKNPDQAELEDKDTQVYEKYDPLLHGKSRAKSDQILTVRFMRKYIHIARCMKPKLTEEASKAIANEYSKLRSEDNVESGIARTQPVTARTLETLIRLSTAIAKARLSKSVSVNDAKTAIELVQFAYFKRVLEKEKKKRRRRDSGEEHTEDEDDEHKKKKRTKRRTQDGTETDQDGDPYSYEEDDSHVDAAVTRATRTTTLREEQSESTQTSTETQETQVELSDQRLQAFQKSLMRMFQEQRTQTVTLSKIPEFVNTNNATPFSAGEIKAALDKMAAANRIMVHDDEVFQV